MKFGIVVFPGSNCDSDCFFVLRHILKQDVVYLWHKETTLANCDCIVLPGGFSYGDYLRCGAIARFSPIMQSVINFAQNGGYVIGICNGFQILLESGLLPGALMRNRDLHFICKYVTVRVENTNTPWTHSFSEGQIIRIPIAHGEGNYHAATQDVMCLEKDKSILFRYCDQEGNTDVAANPNGSLHNIAGITNTHANILGMMPHPERCAEKSLLGEDGKLIFESLVHTHSGA